MKIYCPECKEIFSAELPAEEQKKIDCPKCGANIDYPSGPTAAGAVVGDFLIEREISRGGMGEVYLARQLSLDRPVALKVLQQRFMHDKEYVDSLTREARAAAKINHPNIVQAYAVGEVDGVFFFAMEYIRGETLKQILKREKKLDFVRAAKIIQEIAGALDVAWREQKLVHQDIKPDNIMLDANGFAKLADLGLARNAGVNDSDAEAGDEVMGTPQYISPEQLTGVPTDVRSDIYSLGATFYQFVTGRFPYVADTAEELAYMHVEGKLTPPKEVNPELPDELNSIIMKMMARRIEERYQTPVPLIKALDHFLQSRRSAVAGGMPSLNLKAGAKKTPAAPAFQLPKAPVAPKVAPKPPAPKPVPVAEPAEKITEKAEKVTEKSVKDPSLPLKNDTPEKKEQDIALKSENPAEEKSLEEKTAKEKSPRAPMSKRTKILLIAIGGVLVIALGGTGTFYALTKAGKLPEAVKPYGDKLLTAADRLLKPESAPAAQSAPAVKPKPAPAVPPPPPKPQTRPEYLTEIETALKIIRDDPEKRDEFLAAADRFFVRYPQPQTAEERKTLEVLRSVYGRMDEVRHAAPFRLEAQKRHKAAVAERKQKQLAQQQEEAQRKEAERLQREKLAAEDRKREEEVRRLAEAENQKIAARTEELRKVVNGYYPALYEGFFKLVFQGNGTPLQTAVSAAKAYRLEPQNDSPGEKALAKELNSTASAILSEAERLRKILTVLESVTEKQNGFNVELPQSELVRVICAVPGKVAYRNDDGDLELLPMNQPAVFRAYKQRLASRLKINLTDFEYAFFAQDFPAAAKLLPDAFWKKNWTPLMTAYFREMLKTVSAGERQTLKKRYGTMPEFKAAQQ